MRMLADTCTRRAHASSVKNMTRLETGVGFLLLLTHLDRADGHASVPFVHVCNGTGLNRVADLKDRHKTLSASTRRAVANSRQSSSSRIEAKAAGAPGAGAGAAAQSAFTVHSEGSDHRSAGAMRLEVYHLRRINPKTPVHGDHGVKLRAATRHRDALGPTVFICTVSHHHSILRSQQQRDWGGGGAQDYHAAAFASDETVRPGIERPRRAGGRKHPGLTESDKRRGVEESSDTDHDGGFTFT